MSRVNSTKFCRDRANKKPCYLRLDPNRGKAEGGLEGRPKTSNPLRTVHLNPKQRGLNHRTFRLGQQLEWSSRNRLNNQRLSNPRSYNLFKRGLNKTDLLRGYPFLNIDG